MRREACDCDYTIEKYKEIETRHDGLNTCGNF